MEKNGSVRPTLASLLEYLLNLEGKLREVRELKSKSLAVNQPWQNYLKKYATLPSPNTAKLQQEIDNLLLLIRDCKIAMLEFIPTYFQSISVSVQEQLYLVSKGPEQYNKEPFLIIRPKNGG